MARKEAEISQLLPPRFCLNDKLYQHNISRKVMARFRDPSSQLSLATVHFATTWSLTFLTSLFVCTRAGCVPNLTYKAAFPIKNNVVGGVGWNEGAPQNSALAASFASARCVRLWEGAGG